METKTYNKDKTQLGSTVKKQDKQITTGENELLTPHLCLKKNNQFHKQNLAALWTAQ